MTAWRLTGDTVWRDGAVQAAGSPSRRYNPRGRYLHARGTLEDPANAGRIITDTMANLGPLAFAGRQTGQDRHPGTALAHADTTRRLFPRPDAPTPPPSPTPSASTPQPAPPSTPAPAPALREHPPS